MENYWFKIFALDSLSEYVKPSVSLTDTTPVVLHLLLFMKLQNCISVICWVGVIISSIHNLIVLFSIFHLSCHGVGIFWCRTYFWCSVLWLSSFFFRLDNLLISFVIYAWWNLIEESFDGTLSSKIFRKLFLIKSNISWMGLCEWNFEWKSMFIVTGWEK